MAQAKQDLQAIINDAAQREGVDPELMQKIGGSESSLKASAKNPKSTAKGLFQFVDATWKEMGGKPGQQYDPQKNAELGAKYVKKNVEALAQSLGRDPSHGEVYAAHVFGTTGAKTLLTKADPNAPIEQSLALFESPKRVAKVLKQNPNLQGKTTAQVLADLDRKMGGQKPQAVAQEPAAAAPAKQSPGFFRSPVPKFIRSEAPNLGTGYNAALALMGMSDDELEKAKETVAQNEEENAVADFGQAQKMLAGVQAPNAFANRQPMRMMAKGGEVQHYADGGFTVPVQRNIYRPEDQKYLDEQLAAWNKYNEEANVYNQKLAAYQGSAPVKQYATAAEAYNEKLKEYNATQWEPYKAQVDAYNAKLAQFNQSPEYQAYQQQVDAYNAALNEYNTNVYNPYKTQVDQYNAGLEEFKNSDPFKNYVTSAEAYNKQVEAYNAIPALYAQDVTSATPYTGAGTYVRNKDTSATKIAIPTGYRFVARPGYQYFGDLIKTDFTGVEPTAPTYGTPVPTAPTAFSMAAPTEVKFGEVAPTKPADFSIAPPAAPAGFGEKAPTQPGESIDAVMARRAQAEQVAAKDAEQRGIAIQAANNPNQYNLAGFGAAGINAPTIALMAKGGEAKKSDHDSETEKLFDDFLSAADNRVPVDFNFNSLPAMNQEGLAYQAPPPGMMGRVGTNFDAAGGKVRVGASGMAMQTPDKKIMTMPGMYDVGYNTQVGPGNLDLSFQKEIKAMPGREKNYAVNARYSIPFADGGEVTPEPEKGSAKAMLKEVGRSTQYAPADLAGSPVDLINLGLKGVDAMTGTKLAQEMPVGGAEWIIKKANEYGLMDKPTGSTTENLTRMGMGIVSPTAGPKAMVAAGKAIKGTAKAALEDLAMAGTGQGGSKVAQGVAKATGMEPAFAVRPKGGVSLGASSAADVPLTRIDETIKQNLENIDTNTEQGQAIANFLDKKMRSYYQNQYGTADDPLFKAIMEGRIQHSVAADPRTVDAARAGDPVALKKVRQAYDASTNMQVLGSRAVLKEQGKSVGQMEDEVRKIIKQQSPGEDTLMVTGEKLGPEELKTYPNIYGPKGFKDIVAEGEAGKLLRLLNQTDLQPHVRQAVAKGEPIYGSTGGTSRMLPIGEMTDYLYTRTPAEIKNMGVVDVAVKAKQWHLKMAEARKNPEKFGRKELFQGTEPVLPLEKGTWVDVKTPDALSLEGNIMGHCVGGSNYCNAVAQDKTKIISLRDKKGLPHVTIQLEKTPEGFTRVAQIKGTANNTPEKYFGEINAFLDDYSAKLGKNLTITERPSFVPPQWRDK